MQSTQNSAGHKTKHFRSPALIAVVIGMIMGLRKNFMNEEVLQVILVNSREGMEIMSDILQLTAQLRHQENGCPRLLLWG